MNKNISKTRKLTLTALCAALIAVFTAFVKVPTGINEGYVHLGDTFIYLSACLLPMPYAVVSAAIGGALADILAGAAVWAPFTAIIKALNVIPFALIYTLKATKSPQKIVNKGTVCMPVVSGVITVFGYLLAESFLYNFPSALTSVPFSIIQAVGSAILFYVIGISLDKMNFKNRFFK